MLGSSAFLALCLLAANPETPPDDGPSLVATPAALRQIAFQRDTAESGQQAADAALPSKGTVPFSLTRKLGQSPEKRLPPDPAYDGEETRVAQNDKNKGDKGKEEGIPGLLPGLDNPPPPPEAVEDLNGRPAKPKEKTKAAKDAGGKTAPPKKETKAADHPETTPTPKTDIHETPTQETPAAGEAVCDDGDSIPCEVVHGRPHRHSFFRNWFDGLDFDTWVDQGATINTLSPRDRSNGPVTFNNRSNDYQLNQAYLRLKRDVNTDGDMWDFGGRVDLLYGTDSIYTEARGLETTDDFSPKWNAQQYGLALPQVYAEFFAPWGNGIDMKFGHFYSGISYESVAAPDNFFYSHSYVFQYGEPFTYTGFIGTTKLGDFTIKAGMNRGWDNWEDNNNDLGFNGGIGWESDNKRTKISLTVAVSREQPDPSENVRTLYSLVIQQRLGECWQYVIQHDYANEPGAGVDGTVASWYGVNQYLYREINEHWKAGMRFEWFHDGNGARVPGAGGTGDYFELTGGVNWTPNSYVAVRPEIRWDWAGTPDLYPYGDNTRSNQLLLDCDLIVRF